MLSDICEPLAICPYLIAAHLGGLGIEVLTGIFIASFLKFFPEESKLFCLMSLHISVCGLENTPYRVRKLQHEVQSGNLLLSIRFREKQRPGFWALIAEISLVFIILSGPPHSLPHQLVLWNSETPTFTLIPQNYFWQLFLFPYMWQETLRLHTCFIPLLSF